MRRRILLINDYIGHGVGTVNVLQPLLMMSGHRVSVLLTAMMSHGFQYGDYVYRPLTEELHGTLTRWEQRREEFAFDLVMTGFIDSLGDFRQFATVRSFLEARRQRGAKIIVDPVMGDGGALYPTLPRQVIDEMRGLIRVADVITPNVTEAALLLGEDPQTTGAALAEWPERLAAAGPATVIITDCPTDDPARGQIYYRTAEGDRGTVPFARRAAAFSGSGDYFNAAWLAAVEAGVPVADAVAVAAAFIDEALAETMAAHINPADGLYGVRSFVRLLARIGLTASSS